MLEKIVNWLFFEENATEFWCGNGFSLVFAGSMIVVIAAILISKKLRNIFF